ncbi:pantothenate synthetase [Marinobacter sp. JH2]|nr:pantoate--beta-alanine ligase [Marinobacter sp. JH2]QBM18229.1 pantothenate synthetase [Marinobacter sp. JH2]
MRTVHSLKELRRILRSYRQQEKTIALVPTMGNLHEGHISLVRKASEAADIVVTSIFVNPMQFGANEDLDVYPRTLADDQDKLAPAGNTLIFAPSVSEVYPEGLANQTKVVVPEVSEGHCGASRPGHFEGVATVVTMLLNMIQPDMAFFGEKDFQQLAVIRKLTSDLMMPIEIIGAPTVREEDGLAKSSRNGYLSEEERAIAPVVYKTLTHAAQQLEAGSRDFAGVEQEARDTLANAGLRPDYFNIVNSLTLKPASEADKELTLLVAAFLGTTRLIDNISVTR